MKMSKVLFTEKLPKSTQLGREVLVIYDRKLLKVSPPFKKWLKFFSSTYGVVGGEKIKSVRQLPRHLENILKISKDLSRDLLVIVVGGGSVGDFGGFVASILKRGVRLIQIPSTWLSAIDSAHGGKTALNVENTKNQIGTFYPAEKVYVVKELLLSQPAKRRNEVLGEVVKMGLLNSTINPKDWKKISNRKKLSFKEFCGLKKIINAKCEVVRLDPLETRGLRRVLNLGHTVGHELETQLNLPHGVAVAQGLIFACEWSRRLGYLTDADFKKINSRWFRPFGIKKMKARRISKGVFASHIARDKKRTADNKIEFVFIKGIGKPLLKKMTIKACCDEAIRQGLVGP
ncbi:MAG: hypothetical protein SGJ18_05105 [Pseudomonadota bacterium]|nr:hypothetical protein [Pseudomonadota bacterium]